MATGDFIEQLEQISPDDEDILKFIEGAKPKIYVVGAGGSGSNTITRLSSIGIQGATLVATNTDAAHLVKTRAERKLLIGKKVTRGLGAGSDMKVGEEAALESKEEIKAELFTKYMVYIMMIIGIVIYMGIMLQYFPQILAALMNDFGRIDANYISFVITVISFIGMPILIGYVLYDISLR